MSVKAVYPDDRITRTFVSLAQGDFYSNYLHHFPSRLVADVLQSVHFRQMLPSSFSFFL